MQNIKAGDSVQFKYHNKMRAGRVERTWPSKKFSSLYKSGGFCLDHGGSYKSYSNSKVQFLAKVSS